MSRPAVARKTQYTVPTNKRGVRLDRLLMEWAASGISRSQIQQLIRRGCVKVNGHPTKPGYRVRPGDVVAVHWDIPRPPECLEPEPGPVRVLYRDAALIVVAKPAGIPVHPGAGHVHGTLVHRLIAVDADLARVGHPLRPGIVHRLDRVTSGVMVVARTPAAYQALIRAFQQRKVRKHYLTIVWGKVEPERGIVETRIGRHPIARKRFAVLTRGGKWARTRYRVRASTGQFSLLDVFPLTGRTHQIRVHLTHIGHPVVADPVYGRQRMHTLTDPALRAQLQRIMRKPAILLHAHCIALPHPLTGRQMRFAVAPPRWFRTVWARMTQTGNGT